MWNDRYALSELERLHIVAALEQLLGTKSLPISSAGLKRLRSFVSTGGKSEVEVAAIRRRCNIAKVHGDLNVGNVLVNATQNVVLIDFGSRREDLLSRDIAKFERDLLLRVLDAGTRAYSDWARFETLIQLGRYLAEWPRNTATEPIDDKDAMRIAVAAREFAEALTDGLIEPVERAEHSIALLHFLLKGIALPDLPMPRRTAAAYLAMEILEQLAQEPRTSE